MQVSIEPMKFCHVESVWAIEKKFTLLPGLDMLLLMKYWTMVLLSTMWLCLQMR